MSFFEPSFKYLHSYCTFEFFRGDLYYTDLLQSTHRTFDGRCLIEGVQRYEVTTLPRSHYFNADLLPAFGNHRSAINIRVRSVDLTPLAVGTVMDQQKLGISVAVDDRYPQIQTRGYI